MDTLIELASILNRKRLSHVDVLDKTFLNSKKTDLFYKLYTGLQSGRYTTDKIACAELYGLEKPDHRYRMLKSRLKKRLYNTLLLIDPDDYFIRNEKNKNYYTCIKTMYTVEVLVKINGVNKNVVELIKDNYPIALKFRFYEILKTYSTYLLIYYGLSGNTKEYNKESKKIQKYEQYAQYESKIKQINSRITLLLTDTNSINKSLIEKLKEYIKLYEDTISIFPDPEITYLYYYSLNQLNEISANYVSILDICAKTEELFSSHPYVSSNSRKNILLIYRLKVFLHLNKNKEGINLFFTNQSVIGNPGTYNWILAKEILFKLYLNDLNISDAKLIFTEVTCFKLFRRSYEHAIERWKIYEAYLVFMDSYVNKGDYKFAIGKFLNEVPFYTKDKSGFNFSIKVIEILFHFARKQYNIIFAKTDALKIYRTRYLNDDTYIRSRLFLSALLKAEKDGFNPKRMQQGYPEIDQLKNREKQLIIADWEVIPYEMIWDILVDLGQQQYTQSA